MTQVLRRITKIVNFDEIQDANPEVNGKADEIYLEIMEGRGEYYGYTDLNEE